MDFSEVLQWWEEWQLRVLALASLFVQYFLYFAAPLRKRCIPSWFRFIIWLAYLGSDALAIYALAALFNRHTKQEWVSIHQEDASLEALWAPILLVHLGGVDAITAYNIEDNELWRRYVLTSVSQVAVAVYVFHKSFFGDKRLLQAAIFIFVAGVLKCFEKPVALRSASIRSLMNISRPDMMVDYYPFIDRPSPSSRPEDRSEGKSHEDLRVALSFSFDRLYTKEQVSGASVLRILLHWGIALINSINNGREMCFLLLAIPWLLDLMYDRWRVIFGYLLRAVVNPMIFTALGLFHSSHKGAYNSVDVKITYILLSCTASLEYIRVLWTLAHLIVVRDPNHAMPGWVAWPDQIAQYNLIGYLASKKNHRILTSTTAFLGCEDYLDPLWCMKPCKSSSNITELVSDSIETWMGAATNRPAFSDNRGQWTLKKQGCGDSEILHQSLLGPFDESVLLWHLATEFCYYNCTGNTSSVAMNNSRVISNYMAYLLFINPEMLMTGARPILFRDEYERLNGMPLDDGEPTLEKAALREEELAKKIIQKLKGGWQGEECVSDTAWALYKELMMLCNEDSDRMWKVIEGVWVEMLCFSASRCRGYLHAKSLGKGGEYLSYIWLLLSYNGIETLAQKMQKVPEQGDDNNGVGGGNGGSADRTTPATPPLAARVGSQSRREEEDSNNRADCTTPATTIISNEKRDDHGGSHCTTSAAPTNPIMGDNNV